MQRLHNKKILLGITGSIAAFKIIEVIRNLRDAGAVVRVVMTASAKEFVTPLALQTISGNPVYSELFHLEQHAAIEHIELARWADLILIAPASANFIARLANGFADDLLATLCLASTSKIILVPAMNQQMWRNSLTQRNVQQLITNNIEFWGPNEGSQACGEYGPGRMLELEDLFQKIIENFSEVFPSIRNDKNYIKDIFKNCKILITAGPTQEAIDPVRYISNQSSGKMGYAIAKVAAEQNAQVTLITGPTHLACPENVNCIQINSAQEMYEAVMSQINHYDIFIATAAVADYRPISIATNKLKKSQQKITLNLMKNLDILAAVASLAKPPFTIGFAAETENVLANAKTKLKNKNIDMIAANQVSKNLGFGSDQNALTIITKDGQLIELPHADKNILAHQLMTIIHKHWQKEKKLTHV